MASSKRGMIRMKEFYTTVAGAADAEFVERRSRFIAHVRPVEHENDALAFLNQCKQEYWDATHNVYAYCLEENQLMRYSDDGEPGGTAGLPVLDILKREGLSNLIVVVTRYFGGILLGTGGLVHAYSKAAKLGIEKAGIADQILCRTLTLHCAYPLLGKLQNLLARWENLICTEPVYTDTVSLPVYIPLREAENFCKKMIDLTNAQIQIEEGALCWQSKVRAAAALDEV